MTNKENIAESNQKVSEGIALFSYSGFIFYCYLFLPGADGDTCQ